MFPYFKTLGIFVAVIAILTSCVDLTSNSSPSFEPSTDIVIEQKNTLPQRDEQAINIVQSQHTVDNAAQCLVQHIVSDFKLPDKFYTTQHYDGGETTVQLINPASNKGGLYIDIVPNNNGSRLLLYPNRTTISNEWKKLLEKCR